MAPAVELVHLLVQIPNLQAQGLVQGHPGAAAGLPVVERTLGDGAAEYFLQAHGLGAELEKVLVPGFWGTPLVFHGVGKPESLLSLEGHAGGISVEFHHVTLAGET